MAEGSHSKRQLFPQLSPQVSKRPQAKFVFCKLVSLFASFSLLFTLCDILGILIQILSEERAHAFTLFIYMNQSLQNSLFVLLRLAVK